MPRYPLNAVQDVVSCTMAKTTSYIPLLSLQALAQVRPIPYPPSVQLVIPPDVDVPSKYGLVYEDLTLRTEDGITLRSYLLMQRKEITHTHAMQVDWTEDQSNEDVGFPTCPVRA